MARERPPRIWPGVPEESRGARGRARAGSSGGNGLQAGLQAGLPNRVSNWSGKAGQVGGVGRTSPAAVTRNACTPPTRSLRTLKRARDRDPRAAPQPPRPLGQPGKGGPSALAPRARSSRGLERETRANACVEPWAVGTPRRGSYCCSPPRISAFFHSFQTGFWGKQSNLCV